MEGLFKSVSRVVAADTIAFPASGLPGR